MPVSHNCFLVSAIESMATETEMGYRNCISRSYYSMYHSVLAILKNDIPHYTQGGVHSNLIKYLEFSGSTEPHCSHKLKVIAYILKAAKDVRCMADYDLKCTEITKETAEDAITRANRVIDMCDKLEAAA